jgi:hypothetical protein
MMNSGFDIALAAESSAERGFRTETNSKDAPHPSEELEFVTLGPRAAHVEIQTPGEHRVRLQSATSPREPTSSHNDDLYFGLNSSIPDRRRLSVKAKAASQAEHEMNFMQGVRLCPKAIAWSFLLSMTIVMEGYGGSLLNSFYAFPFFQHAYGA